MPKPKIAALPIAVFILSAALAACGKSENQPVASDVPNKLCEAMRDAGLAKQCTVNSLDSTFGIVADTDDDQKARTLCADIAQRMKPESAGLSDQWKLQIFSPYRDDKPLAACYLH